MLVEAEAATYHGFRQVIVSHSAAYLRQEALMISLRNKVALVTGGSRGIGRAAVRLFAQAGADVAINYRSDKASAESIRIEAERLGVRAITVQADVGNRESVTRMVISVVEALGRIDILVNNAGIWEENPIDGMDDGRLRSAIDSNILGTFYPTIAVVPYMKKQRSGVIINISSTAGQRGEAFHSPYAASKGAVISLTKSLAPELASHNIRVNCVAPGWVDTDMSSDALRGPEGPSIVEKIPLGRAGRPDELAGPILFLASDLATFITGEILNVNGGAVLCG
jgi:3-oxoacyl-[acyl-carrier protein] reductase